MLSWKDQWNRFRADLARLSLVTALSAAILALTAPAALAQHKAAAPAAEKQAKAAGTKTAEANPAPDAAWVKLCEKNAETGNKRICLTHHERLDGNSGMVLVAAAIRQVEGQKKETLLVRLPTAIALAIQAGVQIRVDNHKPVMLKYTLCYATSCQAETEMTPELLKSFRTGKQLVVAAVNLQRKAIGFPIPLAGFSKAYDGPPVDTAKYEAARRHLLELIRQRQIELAKKAAEAEQKKKEAASGKAGASVSRGAPVATQQGPQPRTAVPVQ